MLPSRHRLRPGLDRRQVVQKAGAHRVEGLGTDWRAIQYLAY
jgi:hypothetical protein